ncbi:MAG: sigma-70 family RNA polymerase sigma factor [Pirellulales bacterium]|nr:sigma-70 family RNA polymerase sigma factor [Pirellulales bacterium]
MLDEARHGDPEGLLQRARSGDDSALSELLEIYRPYLALLARLKLGRQLRTRLDDSDLVQDACLAAHRDFAQFRGVTEPELTAWLREIMAHAASNLARDHRRQRRDVKLERRLYNLLNQSSQMLERALADPNPSPSHSAVRRERAVLLANALAQLPGDYREALVLRELEGKSLGEAAQHMGRSADAVQKLWARALVQMRRLMKSSLEQP